MKIEKEFLLKLRKDLEQIEGRPLPRYFENPKYDTEEYYEPEEYTGYASVDKPHIKFFKKGILDAEFPKMKMYDYLYMRNLKNPNFVALNYYGRKITYAEMFYNIEQTAKAFKQLGVQEGDYIVIAMPTTPESVYMLFALNRIGAVAVELDPRTTKEDVANTLLDSKTKMYITMEDNSTSVDEMLTENSKLDKQIENVMFISPTQSLPVGLNYVSDLKDGIERLRKTKPRVPKKDKYINWRNFILSGRSYTGNLDSEYKENQVAEIIYSSGTTNTPKPIEYSNETFTSMVRQVELGENTYRAADKNLNIIPLYLGFGSNNALYTVLCFGLEDILIPVPVTNQLPRLMEKYKPNHVLGAPIHMKILLNYLQSNPDKMSDLSYLRSLVSGSAYLESSKQYALDEELAKRGCKIKVGPGYGQNEAGPGLSLSTDKFLELRKPGCSGYPLTHTTVSIFDPETDEELKYGEGLEGELRYKTPCVMNGYAFNRQKETERFFHQGADGDIWCRSGDLGKIDADGGVYVTGRIERQINRRGFKFSPIEVEEHVVGNIPQIDTCALVAKPDEEEESLPILYYSIKPEYQDYSPIIHEEVVTLCSTLKEYKIPSAYVEMEQLPVTKNLKIDFKSLEREAASMPTEPLKVFQKTN